MIRRGRAWGNALGGWKKQSRAANGQFAGVGGRIKSRKILKAQRRKINRNHKARMRGSRKARVKELGTNGPKRAGQVLGGTVSYTAGHLIGAPSLKTSGLATATKGVRGMRGRVGATRAMSKGLRKSQNRAALDGHYKRIGTTRGKRRAMKYAAGAAAVGGLYVARKKGLWGSSFDYDSEYGRNQYRGGINVKGVGDVAFNMKTNTGNKRSKIPGEVNLLYGRASFRDREKDLGIHSFQRAKFTTSRKGRNTHFRQFSAEWYSGNKSGMIAGQYQRRDSRVRTHAYKSSRIGHYRTAADGTKVKTGQSAASVNEILISADPFRKKRKVLVSQRERGPKKAKKAKRKG